MSLFTVTGIPTIVREYFPEASVVVEDRGLERPTVIIRVWLGPRGVEDEEALRRCEEHFNSERPAGISWEMRFEDGPPPNAP